MKEEDFITDVIELKMDGTFKSYEVGKENEVEEGTYEIVTKPKDILSFLGKGIYISFNGEGGTLTVTNNDRFCYPIPGNVRYEYVEK